MIEAATYGPDGVESSPADTVEDLQDAHGTAQTTWVRATEATDAELDTIAAALDLHDLTVEDVRDDVRPKTIVFEEYTFVVLTDAELRRGDQAFREEIDEEALGVYLGDDWIVTVATGPVPAVDRVWRALEREDPRLLGRGADFTAYRVVDELVDGYFEILDRVETEIEEIEETVVETTDIEVLEGINAVRRDLLAFRKIAWPSRDAVNALARGDMAHVEEETEKYFRDTAAHLVQVVDLIETYRDLTTGTRDIYLNTLSQSTNEVMKVLTVVATIFIPLTFVAGIYGMNFAYSEAAPFNMPELTWEYGYPAVMLGMALVAVVMLVYFRRQEWL